MVQPQEGACESYGTGMMGATVPDTGPGPTVSTLLATLCGDTRGPLSLLHCQLPHSKFCPTPRLLLVSSRTAKFHKPILHVPPRPPSRALPARKWEAKPHLSGALQAEGELGPAGWSPGSGREKELQLSVCSYSFKLLTHTVLAEPNLEHCPLCPGTCTGRAPTPQVPG